MDKVSSTLAKKRQSFFATHSTVTVESHQVHDMTLLKLLSLIIVGLGRIPSFRLMVYLCFCALSKTLESLFIRALPMDAVTRSVFDVLHVIVLVAFVLETFDMLCKMVFDVSLFKRRRNVENEIADTDEDESLLKEANPQTIGAKMKSLLLGLRR